MALKIKSTKITENIVNEKDEPIGKISFDPEDPIIYQKFLHLVEVIEEKAKKDEQIGELQDIPDKALENVKDFEKYKGIFKKLEEKIDNYVEMVNEIKKISDEIFGNVSEPFSKISGSLDPYIELISWATPYFKKQREENVNKYLEKQDEVM